MKKNMIFNILWLCAFIILCFACKKNNPAGGLTDSELYDMAKKTDNFTWYKNSDVFLNKSSLSGHSEPLLRVRYNSVAAAKLDATKKVAAGTVFPDGSLIVKELWQNNTTLSTYAIMYKKAGHIDADASGWVWGYVKPDGSVSEPAANKGAGCRSCHSKTGNIDLTMMNVAIP